jgi:hypothetical protein
MGASKIKLDVAVEPRTVIERGKRPRKVYDAHAYYCGERFSITCNTRTEATSAILRDIQFVRESVSAYHDKTGVSLFAVGHESWYLRHAHGGGTSFRSKDLSEAMAYVVMGFRDHPDFKGDEGFLAKHATCTGERFYQSMRERFKQYRDEHAARICVQTMEAEQAAKAAEGK